MFSSKKTDKEMNAKAHKLGGKDGVGLESSDPNGFDLIVHSRDAVTGEMLPSAPYVAHTVKVAGGSGTLFERPKGSGNLYDKQGKPAGRWDKEAPEGSRHLSDAKHVEFKMPETKDQKLRNEMLLERERNEALERELKALKLENDKKAKDLSAAKKPGA